MTPLANLTSTLVAIEFLYIFYLETFATTSKTTARVFKLKPLELKQKTINTLFKNLGIYNGSIGIMLLLSLYAFQLPQMSITLLVFCVIVAFYGGITSDPMIIVKQGGLPTLSLLCYIFQL